MINAKLFRWFMVIPFLLGCDAFKVAGHFESGRQAFLAKKYDEALVYFQKVAESDPNYMFESVNFREGLWTYIGRSQYFLEKFSEARYSLERALTVWEDDGLARLYLGLTLGHSGDKANGQRMIEAGMKGLHDWIDDMSASMPHSSLWDPQREIRSEIERSLAMISGKDIDWEQLVSSAEWLGGKMEDEIDLVRRQESRPDE